MSNLILCFSEILHILVCVYVKQVAFLSEDWKKLSIWSSALIKVYTSRDEWKGSRWKTNGINRVCSTQKGFRFRAWSNYVGFTVHCLMNICKYLSLSHKPVYQRSWLNTDQFVSLFQWFKQLSNEIGLGTFAKQIYRFCCFQNILACLSHSTDK